MNREVHVRIWERPEVRVLWATRHEERFPPTRLSDGCGFRKETIAGMRRNGRDAPIPAVRGTAIEPPESTLSGHSPRGAVGRKRAIA
jgi:hypothetical protein